MFTVSSSQGELRIVCLELCLNLPWARGTILVYHNIIFWPLLSLEDSMALEDYTPNFSIVSIHS